MPIRPACRKSAPTSTSSISASSRRTATIRGRALPTGTSSSSSRFAICKEAALPALRRAGALRPQEQVAAVLQRALQRSEEHTSELQSLAYLVCRLLLEKKNTRRTDPD